MRYLIPFGLDQLGVPEAAWLLLALGGLSLLSPPVTPRWRSALGVGLFLAIYAWVDGATATSSASLLQRIAFVAIGVAAVLAGSAKPFLVRHVGRAWPWVVWGALAVVSLAFAPFGLSAGEHAAEWAMLGLLLVLTAAIVKPVAALAFVKRFWWAIGLVVLAHASVFQPFGWTLGMGVFLLLFFALCWGIVSQGPELRRYVRRRLAGTPVVMLILITISFFLIRAAPGGPFSQEKSLDAATRAAQEAQVGFDKPLIVQYGMYMGPVVWNGDLGRSFKQIDRTVNEIVAHHIGPSAVLGLTALVLSLFIGMTAGLVSGIRRNSIFDYVSMSFAMVGLAVPTFVVGPLLVLVFAMNLGWFDVSGWGEPQHIVLPAITLALPFAARVARLTRAGMLEVVHQDYIRTARAKGLSETAIVIRHTLKGALLPVASFLGPAIAQVMTGSLVVELIFGVPGLGREFVQSAINRDYWLVLGLVLVFGALLIAFTLIVDILYAFLDPRIRHG